MSENKDFTEIMQNITAGLTGDSKTDFKYLNSQMEKYKDHKLGTEIVRACGRMIYSLLSDEQKEDLEKAAVSDNAGREAALEEVRFNIYKGNWTRAYELIEKLVQTPDESRPFQDDQVSEYHTFQEPFEDALFRVMFRPQKTLRQPPINFSEIYYLYGAILVELGKLEEAKTALQTARRWNPVDVKILFEYLDVINREKDYELFYRLTMDAFKISFKPESVARCYRNLGFYYVEKELYEAAVACYRISELYDPNTRQVQSELYYISEKMGEPIKQQSSSEIIALSKEYGFPNAPDETILELAVTFGKDAYNAGDYDYAAYFLGIAYRLTHDEGLVEMLDDIEKKLSEESDEIEIEVSIDDNIAPP